MLIVFFLYVVSIGKVSYGLSLIAGLICPGHGEKPLRKSWRLLEKLRKVKTLAEALINCVSSKQHNRVKLDLGTGRQFIKYISYIHRLLDYYKHGSKN